MRWAWFAFLAGCAGASTSASSGTTESAHADDRVEATGDSSEDVATEPVRVNLSAGPASAEPALVPQSAQSSFVGVIHIVRDRPMIITGTDGGGLVSVIDIPSGHVRAARRFFRGLVRSVDASSDGTRVLVAGTRYSGPDNPRLGVWDLRDDTFTELKGMERQLSDAAISPDGERAVWITHEWEEATRLHLGPTSGGDVITREVAAELRDVSYASDGSAVVAVGGDSVLVVDPQTGETRETMTVTGAREIESSSNGRWHAVRGTESVLVFDGRGRERARLNVGAHGMRFDADGAKLVVCTGGALVVYSGNDLSESVETEVECGENVAIDARWEPMSVSINRRTMTIRRDGAEPIEEVVEAGYWNPYTLAFPRSVRRRWFLVSRDRELFIYNLRLQRLRRIVAAAARESSAWSVGREGDVIRLKGRDWHRDFPRDAQRVESTEPAIAPPERAVPYPSPDGQAMVVVLDPYGAAQPALMVAGRDEPRRLSLPRSAVFNCYDYDVEAPTCGGGKPVWGPGNQFVLLLEEGMVAYAANGRRVGHSTTATSVEYADDATLLVEHADGSLTLSTLRFQRRMRVFNARQGGTVRTGLGNGRLAATRGRVLQLVDVASAEQQHRIELTAPATADPTFVDDQVQLRTRDGIFRWSLADGTETMRVAIDDIRALSEDESEALYCADGRLRWRLVAQEASTDLMPCPTAGWMQFDGDFVYWVEGNAGHVLRRADGQRIVVRSLGDGAYGFASTPQGHLFATDDEVLGALRLRGPGAILDASLDEVGADRLTPSLITDFLAGRALR